MNQTEFLEKYEAEKPFFRSWGCFLVESIKTELVSRHIDLSTFLKVPVDVRVKDNMSIIAKAFLRKEKHYEYPYEQITDKVGTRFVVLELSEISIIKEIIEKQSEWESSKDVDFENNRVEKPELFEYQSVHYIVRNCNIIDYKGVSIPVGTPCEVQIRTLLQHAYAELSHQTIYKSTAQIHPNIKRKIARSMALIETTDEIFKEVRQDMRTVDELYLSIILSAKKLGDFPHYIESLNSSIFETYKNTILSNSISPDTIDQFVSEKSFILDKVSKNICSDILYEQPIIYLLYYLALKYSSTTKALWPFDSSYIEPIYSDLGISLST